MDLLEDVGISLSPEVDIGQIEGAYVMGLGLYTSEELVYDDNTGKILTNRTWVTYSIRLNLRRSLYTGDRKSYGHPRNPLIVHIASVSPALLLECK